MKEVKCKSGLTGWQCKLRKNYNNFEEFESYSEMWGIAKRLGFVSHEEAWNSNPTICGSVEPSDLSIVYFHVIKDKNSLRIKETIELYCTNVKNSIASFINRDGALSHLNNITLN